MRLLFRCCEAGGPILQQRRRFERYAAKGAISEAMLYAATNRRNKSGSFAINSSDAMIIRMPALPSARLRKSTETPLYRSMRRARKIRARLGASPSLADALPTKPKGMHASTYQRLLAQAQRADAAWVAATEKRFGRI
jgi:hypothetical protein